MFFRNVTFYRFPRSISADIDDMAARRTDPSSSHAARKDMHTGHPSVTWWPA